jgi:beta-mannosidase
MVNQIKAFFGTCPETLDEFILASQITQAEAMKFFVEIFRQNKGYDAEKGQKQGILWWNIRDGWPILSDAVVDYYFRKKLAFHYIQSVQRDVQAICCEEAAGQHAVVVVNDTLKPARGHLEINRAGETARLLDTAFDVETNGKATLGSLPHPARNEMWRLKWTTESIGLHTSHYLAFTPTVNFEEIQGVVEGSRPSAGLNTRYRPAPPAVWRVSLPFARGPLHVVGMVTQNRRLSFPGVSELKASGGRQIETGKGAVQSERMSSEEREAS